MVVIIPALDEAKTIGPLVKALRHVGHDVIVVDDGSVDGTGGIAGEMRAAVVRHDETQGIRSSILDGFKFGMAYYGHARHFATMDAGGSHDPKDLDSLALVDADVVIGSRFCHGAGYIGNPARALYSKIAAHALNVVAHTKITDWTSGYRIYSRKAVETMIYRTFYATGHAFQIETLSMAVRGKTLTIGEAPITYTAGRSSLRWPSVEQAFFLWLELFAG